FQEVNDSQALDVVLEAAGVIGTGEQPDRGRLSHELVEGLLAGVAERGVAEIVSEDDRFDQVLIDRQGPSDRPADLSGLDGVGESRAVVIALEVDEDLSLVLEPAK